MNMWSNYKSHDKNDDMPTLGQHFKTSSPESNAQLPLIFGIWCCGCVLYNVWLIYYPSLTLIYFMTRSNVFLNVFIWGKTLKTSASDILNLPSPLIRIYYILKI